MPTYPVWMIDGRKTDISSGFRTLDRPTHNGADIAWPRLAGIVDGWMPVGTPRGTRRWVALPGATNVAYRAGRVVRTEWQRKGGVVELAHDDGIHTIYRHNSSFLVSPGMDVPENTALGMMGANPLDGANAFIHLHFEVIVGGNYVNPEPYLRHATHRSGPDGASGGKTDVVSLC